MNWNWFLGFIEGEGTFTIGLEERSKKDYKSGYNVVIMFQLPQKYSTKNVVLMNKIKRFLESQGITTGKKQPYVQKKKEGWATVKIVVSKLDSLVKLAEELKKLKWQTSKYEEFKLWCQAIEIKRSGEHLKESGIRKLEELRNKKKEIYKYSPKKLMRFGRKKEIDKELLNKIINLKQQKISNKDIARLLKIGTPKLRFYLQYNKNSESSGK